MPLPTPASHRLCLLHHEACSPGELNPRALHCGPASGATSTASRGCQPRRLALDQSTGPAPTTLISQRTPPGYQGHLGST